MAPERVLVVVGLAVDPLVVPPLVAVAVAPLPPTAPVAGMIVDAAEMADELLSVRERRSEASSVDAEARVRTRRTLTQN